VREIKFRAWCPSKKAFINGFNMFGFSTGQGSVATFLERYDTRWKPEDFILMQFAGMKDKNGREIYEGDIVEGRPPNYVGICRGVVEYGALAFAFVGKKQDGERWFDTVTNPTHTIADIEVIGNIYENPELLKGEQS